MTHQPLTVLLVEDNAGDADLIKGTLNHTAHSPHVIHVERWHAATCHITHSHIDVLLVGLSVPDIRGPEQLSQALQLGTKVPIIVIGGPATDEDLGRRPCDSARRTMWSRGNLMDRSC